MPATNSTFLATPGIELFKTLLRGDAVLYTTPCIYPTAQSPVSWDFLTMP